MNSSSQTIPGLFEASVEKYGPNPFLWEKQKGMFQKTSYREVRELVQQFAAGLLSLGINHGDRVALLSEGRNMWIIAELGILSTGAVNVPLSVKLEAGQEVAFRLNHSGARFLVASGQQLSRLGPIHEKAPALEKLILLDPPAEQSGDFMLADDLMAAGRQFLQKNPGVLEQVMTRLKASDYANICYTSGTTADPKGILLTHGNYVTNATQSITLMDIPSWFRTLCILPLDHSFAHTAAIYSFMKVGASLGTVQTGKGPNETLRNIPLNIKELKPHLILSVPTLAKNFKKNIEKGIREKGRFASMLFDLALRLSYSYHGDGFRKPPITRIWKKPLLNLFDHLLFRKVRQAFGGELRFFIGGGAMLDIDLQRFYYAIGIPMFQGYGLSEASPIISSNAPQRHKLGSSGFLVKDLELKICDEKGKELPRGEKGEIVIKGGNVMAGYWKNPDATADALRDGWLHTGDMGFLDPDGFLFVLGRFKSLLISNDGEKYSPEGIEEAITEHCPSIDQIMLHNNQNPYTVALIFPNTEQIRKKLGNRHHTADKEDVECQGLQIIRQEIAAFRPGGSFGGMFPERWLPTTFAVIDEPFSEKNSFMNSTLKIVRSKITAHYNPRIQELHTPEGKEVCNRGNRQIMADLLKGK